MQNNSDIKTFCIYVNKWCPRRGLEASRVKKYFLANGLKAVSHPGKADLIVIFTCGVFWTLEEASVLTIEHALKNKTAKIVITGCLPKIDPNRIKTYNGAVTILPKDLGEFDTLIRAKMHYNNTANATIVQGIHNLYRGTLLSRSIRYVKRNIVQFIESLVRYYNFGLLKGSEDLFFAPTTYKLEIAKGCLGNCSFCAIKLAMEKFHSFSEEQIIESLKTGLENGYKNFALVAGDIGCYGIDRQTSLPTLLKKIFVIEGDFKIFLWDLNARWFVKYYAELLEILKKNSTRISKIVVPIESGSNRILKLMNRGYKIEKVTECLLDLVRTIPEINLETQIIVGFPGEADEDFQKTLEMVKTIRFSKVVVFKYEDRPNTKAVNLPGKVPKSIINNRAKALAKVVATVIYRYDSLPKRRLQTIRE